MGLRLTAPSKDTATLRRIAASGRSLEANEARAELTRRLHAALRAV